MEDKQKKQEAYEKYVKEKTPVHKLVPNMAKAFVTGGVICVIGQVILNYCEKIGLDKDTSGLLMIAKNDQAHESLSEQLRERTMDKRYLAVVDGEMKDPSGRIEKPIARSKKDRKKMAVDPEGRYALTEWTLKENLRGAALLEVHILTGRTHQIRVHMQSIHHPVAGDPIYGMKNGVKAPRLMLHAWRLSFTHPRTGERLSFCAQPPETFARTVEKLRIHS